MKKKPIYEFAVWQEASHWLQNQGKEQMVRAGEKQLLGGIYSWLCRWLDSYSFRPHISFLAVKQGFLPQRAPMKPCLISTYGSACKTSAAKWCRWGGGWGGRNAELKRKLQLLLFPKKGFCLSCRFAQLLINHVINNSWCSMSQCLASPWAAYFRLCTQQKRTTKGIQ